MTVPAKKPTLGVKPPVGPVDANESWFVRLVYAGTGKEWVFSCDGVTADELRRAMLDRRPAHLKHAGTEAIVNPEHVATVEFQKQPAP